MDFLQKRRQQFLSEKKFASELEFWDDVIKGQHENLLKPEGGDRGWHLSLRQGIAQGLFIQLLLRYTAGEPIAPLRQDIEAVVKAYEIYGEHLWKSTGDRNAVVFEFTTLDDYCELMQIIGLCFLLHRRDLLPRVAALQDGDNGSNGGVDTLFEELIAFGIGADKRYESDWLCHKKPYEPLFHGLTEESPEVGRKEFDRFLKRWYKDMEGTGWHDSHKPNADGEQGGYFGYWSFEAGAAVLLLGIEDDCSLHKYLYYPKDLVAWSKEHAALSEANAPGKTPGLRLRCEANQPCPKTGYWFTPARVNSRTHFEAGQNMPDTGSSYGATIWQWDEQQ